MGLGFAGASVLVDTGLGLAGAVAGGLGAGGASGALAGGAGSFFTVVVSPAFFRAGVARSDPGDAVSSTPGPTQKGATAFARLASSSMDAFTAVSSSLDLGPSARSRRVAALAAAALRSDAMFPPRYSRTSSLSDMPVFNNAFTAAESTSIFGMVIAAVSASWDGPFVDVVAVAPRSIFILAGKPASIVGGGLGGWILGSRRARARGIGADEWSVPQGASLARVPECASSFDARATGESDAKSRWATRDGASAIRRFELTFFSRSSVWLWRAVHHQRGIGVGKSNPGLSVVFLMYFLANTTHTCFFSHVC